MWTAENDSNTLRVDAKIFASAKKYFRKKKFVDTCGHGLNVTLRTSVVDTFRKAKFTESWLPQHLVPNTTTTTSTIKTYLQFISIKKETIFKDNFFKAKTNVIITIIIIIIKTFSLRPKISHCY